MTTIDLPTTDTPVEPTVEPTVDPTPFADRVLAAALGAQEVHATYLGDRLGWYRALADADRTSVELAEATGTDERYAREWLEHQATCGYLTVDDAGAAPTARRYHLPPAHAEVLTDDDSLSFLAPLAQFIAGVGLHLDTIADAYRTGAGVSWAELGRDPREAQAALNRPLFLHHLTQELLPSAPEVHDRLAAPGARIADIGCGGGWSAIGLARGYAESTVDGFDLDEPSIALARRNATTHEVDDRTRFWAVDGADVEPTTPYDAVFAFECIHDMADPVSVLTTMRRLAGEDGVVVVMDEAAEDEFTPDGSEVERLLYGFSLTCCLPDGRSADPSAATGTVMRTATLTDYATRAGFGRVEVLPLEHDVFRFYRLHL